MFWFSVSNMIHIIAGIICLVGFVWWLLMIILAFFTGGTTLAIASPFVLIWAPVALAYLAIGLFSSILHVFAVRKEGSSVADAFRVAKSTTGANALSLWIYPVHVLAWVTLCVGVGFLIFFVAPAGSIVALIFALKFNGL